MQMTFICRNCGSSEPCILVFSQPDGNKNVHIIKPSRCVMDVKPSKWTVIE